MSKKNQPSVINSLGAKLSFKLIILGDSGVGKTSLVIKYVKDTFSKNSSATIGVQFYSKILEIDGDQIALQIWDTVSHKLAQAGHEDFKFIVKSFYRQACCVIIAYCDPELASKSINNYLEQINEHGSEAVRIIIVRTKVDELPVSEEEKALLGQFVQRDPNVDFWKEISAKDNTNVKELFEEISKKLRDLYISNEDFKQLVDPTKGSFLLKSPPQQLSKKGPCCN